MVNLSAAAGFPEQDFLDERHVGEGQVHAQVAAGDHHAVRDRGDLVEGVDRGARLDLGHQQRAFGREQRAEGLDVVGRAHERLGDQVHPQLQRKGNAFAVRVRDGGTDQSLAGHVDAGLGPDHPSAYDLGGDRVIVDAGHSELGRAVGQQDSVAHLELLRAGSGGPFSARSCRPR